MKHNSRVEQLDLVKNIWIRMLDLGKQLRFLFMHIDDYTIGVSYDCDQISNIYQYIIYIDKLDGTDWKKWELGESFDYSIISMIDWCLVIDATFSNISAKSWRPVLVGQATDKLYHFRLRVECNLFVIYKAGREPTPYWW